MNGRFLHAHAPVSSGFILYPHSRTEPQDVAAIVIRLSFAGASKGSRSAICGNCHTCQTLALLVRHSSVDNKLLSRWICALLAAFFVGGVFAPSNDFNSSSFRQSPWR